jgi:transposase-like protein
MAEMYVLRISTRKVKNVLEKMCGLSESWWRRIRTSSRIERLNKENKFAFATFALRSFPESGIVRASHRLDTDGTARRMDDGQGLPNRQGKERLHYVCVILQKKHCIISP